MNYAEYMHDFMVIIGFIFTCILFILKVVRMLGVVPKEDGPEIDTLINELKTTVDELHKKDE